MKKFRILRDRTQRTQRTFLTQNSGNVFEEKSLGAGKG
jgi:hypothetical protein